MASQVIAETLSPQQARARALIVPREHGAWGLLFIPLFTGAAAGIASSTQAWPLLPLSLAALALFWLRTPVESLLGTSALSAQTSEERRIAGLATAGLSGACVACLASLLWNGRNPGLLILGAVATCAFVAQTVLKKFSRHLRMASQMVGAIGLTCTAPAAYYVATGHLDRTAWILWSANWIFSGDQIHFVQLRIHAARATTFKDKFTRGFVFFVLQIFLLIVLVIAAALHLTPALFALAFLPSLFRGFLWFFRKPQALQVKNLGWSEMRQGIMFGVLLAAAIIVSM